ncbi:MAG: glycosyltransferase family A protein [Candidatus Kariarchaeaceae archaeon]|jgi:hypothetical protein
MVKFKSIEEKLAFEVECGYPLEKLSKKQYEEKLQEQRDVYLIPREKMTFVIAHCIYNEVEYFKDCLEDDLKFNDVDVIHIMDGAWEHYSGGTPESNDGTLEIISEFRKKAKAIGIEVIYESKDLADNGGIWRNQGEKRNSQLKAIDDIIDEPYYILIKDGDEFVHFLNGRQSIWIKRDMVEWQKTSNDVGILRTNSFNSDIDLWGARFLPSTNKVHYYSEKPMIIHDTEHKVVMNYNTNGFGINNSRCFKFASLMFINHWNKRNFDRVVKKEGYIKHQLNPELTPCRFK